ncbi:MAG: hypothetical protein U5K37_07890 [Natrialbaceae archaeon]|nr:hypothetical protein [Natrialbaceae archaeon]
MRDRLIGELGTVPLPGFLVFLMGPYTSFPVAALLPTDHDADEVSLPSARASDETIDEMLATLRRVQGNLRVDPGVNAFLAVDADIPLDRMDAATQSIRFARVSNVIAFIVPYLGANLGVGMEIGAVLEDLYPGSERAIVIHEDNVSSGMLGSVSRRWEATIISYSDEEELVDELQLFIADIMIREAVGDLPPNDRS